MDTAEQEQGGAERATVERATVLPGARRPPGTAADAAPALGSAPSSALASSDTAMDVVDLLALEAFTRGREPFARTRGLEHVRPGAPLVPPGASVLREAHGEHRHVRLAVGPGWTVHATHWPRSREATVVVTAVSGQLADEQLGLAVAGAVAPVPRGPERVVVDFWRQTGRGGPRRVTRRIEAAPWESVRENYATPVARSVDDLVRLDGTDLSGRLLLLHGPPGTGKTSLLRTLARAWRSWCRLDCVLDPEQLFGDPSYLLHVALGGDDDDSADDSADGSADGSEATGTDGTDERPWRLLLLEDCDELIRREAKSSAGQHLSRLLNLTDGLLGQGRRVLVAITTNEDVAVLHPALTRPGRCLARLEVGRLGQGQARAWLGEHDAPAAAAERVGPEGATLAELYALRSGAEPLGAATVGATAADRPGLYL